MRINFKCALHNGVYIKLINFNMKKLIFHFINKIDWINVAISFKGNQNDVVLQKKIYHLYRLILIIYRFAYG